MSNSRKKAQTFLRTKAPKPFTSFVLELANQKINLQDLKLQNMVLAQAKSKSFELYLIDFDPRENVITDAYCWRRLRDLTRLTMNTGTCDLRALARIVLFQFEAYEDTKSHLTMRSIHNPMVDYKKVFSEPMKQKIKHSKEIYENVLVLEKSLCDDCPPW